MQGHYGRSFSGQKGERVLAMTLALCEQTDAKGSSPGLNSLSSESRAGSFADGVDGKFGNRDRV